MAVRVIVTRLYATTEGICRFDYEKDGIMVFKEKKLHAKLHSFATRGVVSSPYTHVSEFVKDPQSTFVWDSFLVVC